MIPDSHIRVDVAVVGAGVAGLWTARVLRKEGVTVALMADGQIGGGQTSHSHVYLHGGHLYLKEMQDGRSLVADMIDSNASWEALLRDSPPADPALAAPHELGYFGFPSMDVELNYLSQWGIYGLGYSAAATPGPIFDRSPARRLHRVEARCLNAAHLVRSLAESLEDCIVDGLVAEVEPTGDGYVVTADHTGAPLRVNAGSVVLAAGAGNEAFVRRHAPERAAALSNRPSYMLVIRGPRSVLPPVSGMYWLRADYNLFIVSRVQQDTVTWLVSAPERDFDLSSWRGDTIESLLTLFPAVRGLVAELDAGAYFAPKAEVREQTYGGHVIGSPTTMTLAPGLVAVWPSKLTLAPVAAQLVYDELVGRLGTAASQQPDLRPFAPARVAPELWESVDFVPLTTLMPRD